MSFPTPRSLRETAVRPPKSLIRVFMSSLIFALMFYLAILIVCWVCWFSQQTLIDNKRKVPLCNPYFGRGQNICGQFVRPMRICSALFLGVDNETNIYEISTS